ncbi:major facilitator superfamily domain-containing protein [Dipodascopsis tothii]|uniref:major facilitator superfamily domain-containing protein n=1 Tax=Dipodascopsis tothii TaxID=44089 RepID=UPI0034CDDC8C
MVAGIFEHLNWLRARPGRSLRATDSSQPTILNVATYLLSCFCSIAFLVFLNAMQSFVITVLLRLKDNIGDYVGTLGFIDELVSVVMCPLWGTLSDKIGTRTVCSVAYVLVGLALFTFVQAGNVYPDLVILRIMFAFGGSATAAMVTALLSEVSRFELYRKPATAEPETPVELTAESEEWYIAQAAEAVAPVVPPLPRPRQVPPRNGRLSGLVGLCTGLGAVFAVVVFLPIPTRLEQRYGMSPEAALRGSFYIVGCVAICVGGVLYAGLKSDDNRSITAWIRSIRYARRHSALVPQDGDDESTRLGFEDSVPDDVARRYLEKENSYLRLLVRGFTAAREPRLFLAYSGGLIARAASVAVSLFIPLFINQFFYNEGICRIATDPLDVKTGCREAYILSAILTGVAETVALFSAPLWGYACDRFGKPASLAYSALIGVIGFGAFGLMADPRASIAYLWASLIGVAQIGAIVCSLSLCTERKTDYSGSIAGVYSVTGAAGILLLTKVGGWASDVSKGAPFIIMALLNGGLLLCAGAVLFLAEGGAGHRIMILGRDVLRARERTRERENLGERMSYTINNDLNSADTT